MDYGSRQRESRRAGQHQEKKTEKIQLKHTQEVKGEREREKTGEGYEPSKLTPNNILPVFVLPKGCVISNTATA